jgi:hypothetical protein
MVEITFEDGGEIYELKRAGIISQDYAAQSEDIPTQRNQASHETQDRKKSISR